MQSHNSFRSHVARLLVMLYGLILFVTFALPGHHFLDSLAKSNRMAALLTESGMLVLFLGTLVILSRLWIPLVENGRTFGMSPRLLRWCRNFVGNGDHIQQLARRVDPYWKNPYSGSSPKQTANWLIAAEVFHWAILAGTLPLILAALAFHRWWPILFYLPGNLLYNLVPILVLRETRSRVIRIYVRRAARSTCIGSVASPPVA